MHLGWLVGWGCWRVPPSQRNPFLGCILYRQIPVYHECSAVTPSTCWCQCHVPGQVNIFDILWLKKKNDKLNYVCRIIMNFSEDWGVGIIYLPTKFQLHRFISNGDLLSDRNRWKCAHKRTHRQTDTLPIHHMLSTKFQVFIPPLKNSGGKGLKGINAVWICYGRKLMWYPIIKFIYDYDVQFNSIQVYDALVDR